MKIKQQIKASILVILMLTILFLGNGCRGVTIYGIPTGLYRQIDESGSIIGQGGEFGWQIRNNKTAEHRYIVFAIIQDDGKVFFEHYREPTTNPPRPNEAGLFRYEVAFDTETNILTVYMPFSHYWNGNAVPHHVPNRYREIRSFQFVLTTWSNWLS